MGTVETQNEVVAGENQTVLAFENSALGGSVL